MNNSIHWTVFLIQFGVGIRLVDEFFVVPPRNAAVYAGQRMEMECRTDNESIVRRWTFRNFTNLSTLLNSDIKHLIKDKELQRSGFGIDVDKNYSTILYSNATKIQDAGIYTCNAEKGGKESIYSAALIVLQGEPVCEMNTSKDYITMHCKVHFVGKWNPIMEWRLHETDASEGHLVEDINMTLISEDYTEIITSSISMSLTSVNCSSSFSCKIYFTDHNNSLKVNATNKPDFNYTWNSPAVKVTCYSMFQRTTYSKDNTTTSIGESIYILFAVISVIFVLPIVVTTIIGCVIVRLKTSEWLAKFVAAHNQADKKLKRETQRTVETTRENNNDNHVSLPREDVHSFRGLQLFKGYKSADNLTRGIGLHSDFDIPIYSQVNKNTKGRSCMELDIYQDETELEADQIVYADAAMAQKTHSLIKDNPSYNTQESNITETPEHDSIGIYAKAQFID